MIMTLALLRRAALATLLMLLPLQAVKADERAQTERTPTIVLVHGAFMDARTWEAVERELSGKGFRTIAVNLPGRTDTADSDPEAKLATYRDAVLDAIVDETGPVLLVGHSFGGITISSVAEAAPDRIAALVYLAAYLPTNGQSLQMLAGADRDSRTGEAFVVDAARGVASIAPALRGPLFCNDCDPATANATADLMVDEPLAPLGQPALLGERFASVPRYYIRTGRDRVISPAQQDRMIAATPVVAVLDLDSGHSPMLSRPGDLARVLARLAQATGRATDITQPSRR
ncbi:MAG: alpha/beta fold hydrolase [Porphyrobacter sp.]|jgi:pimeloyl-ACP methyl ester carboxylesterase|nr:alpha/beta fold hydrolase [Porphyrobacter sp.]